VRHNPLHGSVRLEAGLLCFLLWYFLMTGWHVRIDDPKNNEQRPTSYKLLCFSLEVDLIMWWSSLIPRNI